MNLLTAFLKIIGHAMPNLVELLQAGKAALPDKAADFDSWLEKLGAAVDPTNVAETTVAILKEPGNIIQGKLDPKRHRADLV